MVLELQRANGMCNALDGIGLSVSEIVHRIDAPLIAGAVVVRVKDAVHDRIPEVQIRRGHIDFGPQGSGAIGKLAGAHPLEQVEVFFHRTVAVWALLSRLGQCAALLANLFRRQVADVSLPGLD